MKKIISFEKKLEFPSMIGEVTAISLDHNLTFADESNVTGEFSVSGTYKLTEASRLEEKFDYKIPAEIIMNERLDLSTAKLEIDDFYYEIENDDTMICYIDVKLEGVEQIEEEEEPAPTIERVEVEPVPTMEEKEEQITEPVMEELESSLVATIAEVPSNKEELEEVRCIEVEEVLNQTEEKEELAKVEPEVRECDGDPEISDVTVIARKEKEQMESETEMEEKEMDTMMKEEAMGSLFSSFKDSDETFATYSVYILRQEETVQSVIEKYKTTKEELENYNDLSNLTTGTKIIIPTKNEQ